MNLIKIKRAIISVSDKSNLEMLILPILKKFNIEIIKFRWNLSKKLKV